MKKFSQSFHRDGTRISVYWGGANFFSSHESKGNWNEYLIFHIN